jgi:hypothetical protein
MAMRMTSEPATTMAELSDAEALVRFRSRVVAEPALQARLFAIDRPEAFAEAASALAAELGLPLPAEALLQWRRPEPIELDDKPPAGWLPTRSAANEGLAFDWVRFGDRALAEPFYEDAVRRVAASPFNRMFRARTNLKALMASAADAPAPTGLIFHMSRCGSTLAARMLAAVPHHHFVSEPEPVDAVVQWARGAAVPTDTQVAALRAIVAAFARHRAGAARRFFLKLDAWDALALPLFRATFPDTPWVFLYRDPIEVMASHLAQPGAHMIEGVLPPHALGIANGFPPVAYGVEVLARIGEAALDYRALGGGMLVDYAGLAEAMTGLIPTHFGFTPDAEEAAAMGAAAGEDAKRPGAAFVSDVARKRAAVPPAVATIVEARLRPVHRRLREATA